jgi:hypothetical protein
VAHEVTSLHNELFCATDSTPASDVAAFTRLAKSAATKDEPDLRNALMHAWKGASHGLSLTEVRIGIREKNWPKLAKLWMTAEPKVRAVVEPRLQASYLRGVHLGARPVARRAKSPVRFSLNMMNPHAAAWARSRAGLLVADDAQARALIREFVTNAVEDGFSVDETAELIRDVIGLDSRRALAAEKFAERANTQQEVEKYIGELLDSRAMTIARTEIMMAQSAGQHELWQQSVQHGMLDGDMRKVWITTDDEKLCDECDQLAKDTEDDPIGMDEAFDDDVMFPPLHPNCRCTMGLVTASSSGEDDEDD